MSKHLSYILVLGASGMLGRTIFKYLYYKHPLRIYGTARKNMNNPHIFVFDVNKNKVELENLKNNNYEYFINCIGSLREDNNKKSMSFMNSNFPKILDDYCRKTGIKLIHVSTDAVFPDESGIVYENSKPYPSDYYGQTKLAGEVTTGINIRTSILGFDPLKHKGLLEFVIANKNSKIRGFTNQQWSGSTTLQLAQFIEWMTSANNFNDLFKKTRVTHFAPLGPTTKYEIIKTFSRLIFKIHIQKDKGAKQLRILKTRYVEEIKLKRYTNNLRKAFQELIKFDLDYVKTYKKN